MKYKDHDPSTDTASLAEIQPRPESPDPKRPGRHALPVGPCVELGLRFRPCYGPCGLAKSLLFRFPDGFPGRPVSSPDTASVLARMELEDPRALTLASAASTQAREHGDGAALVLLLASSLLSQAGDLLALGVTGAEIQAGYRQACGRALRLLEGMGCGRLEEPREELQVRGVLGGFLACWQPGFQSLLEVAVARSCVHSWRPLFSGVRGEMWEGVTFDPSCVRVCTALEKEKTAQGSETEDDGGTEEGGEKERDTTQEGIEEKEEVESKEEEVSTREEEGQMIGKEGHEEQEEKIDMERTTADMERTTADMERTTADMERTTGSNEEKENTTESDEGLQEKETEDQDKKREGEHEEEEDAEVEKERYDEEKENTTESDEGLQEKETEHQDKKREEEQGEEEDAEVEKERYDEEKENTTESDEGLQEKETEDQDEKREEEQGEEEDAEVEKEEEETRAVERESEGGVEDWVDLGLEIWARPEGGGEEGTAWMDEPRRAREAPGTACRDPPSVSLRTDVSKPLGRCSAEGQMRERVASIHAAWQKRRLRKPKYHPTGSASHPYSYRDRRHPRKVRRPPRRARPSDPLRRLPLRASVAVEEPLDGEACSKVTVTLRSADQTLLESAEGAVAASLRVYRSLLMDPRVVPGAGASEAGLARGLTRYGLTLVGMEQLAVHAFAQALLEPVKTLGENAGTPADRAVLRRYGGYWGRRGEGVETLGLGGGVVDGLGCKSSAIQKATEATLTILTDLLNHIPEEEDKSKVFYPGAQPALDTPLP